MYFVKRMGNTGEPWGISVFVGFIAILWPSIASNSFLSFIKSSIHLISCRLVSSSFTHLVSLVLNILSKAPFMSMRSALAIFPFAWLWYTSYIRYAAIYTAQ
jgi:hypothetical protein